MRRVNLLHAHGSPTSYLYGMDGCRCVACRGQVAARDKAYRADHREEYLAREAAYRADHKKEIAAYGAAYYAAHREEVAASGAARRADHPEEEAARHAAYYADHRDETAARHGAYRADNREEIAARRLERRYGLLPGGWGALFAAQGDHCAICARTDPGHKHGWHTDHDHKTGVVRGILCHGCNTGLGGFRDDPGRLVAAIEYLEAKP